MKRILAFIFILFLTVSLSACGNKKSGIPKAIVDIKTIQEEEIIESLNSTGRIIALYDVDIVARVDGYLERKFFQEGSIVKKGDLLYEIEPYTYAAKVSEASANLRNSQASLVDSSKNLYRAEQLVKEDLISKSDYDDKLALRDKDKASVDSNKAALRQAQINLGYTKIYSPIDGKIGKMFITEGNYVTPNSGVLARIVSLDPAFVDFPLKSKDYLTLSKASKVDNFSDISVEIKLADDTIYSEKGTIEFIGNVIDKSSGTVDVRAKFKNPQKLLIPGDYVSVKITLETPRTVIMVPQEAVGDSSEGKYLYIIDKNKVANKRMIEVSDEYDGNWIISSGVDIGDTVATSGLQYIIPGQKITIRNDAKKEAAEKAEIKSVSKPSFFERAVKKIKKALKGIMR